MTPSEELKHAIKVVKVMKKLGVSSIKLGTLEIELFSEGSEPRVSHPTLKVSAKKLAEATEKNQLQSDFEEVKDDLSVMHVEDPSGFEAALIDQELDDIDEGGEVGKETHDS